MGNNSFTFPKDDPQKFVLMAPLMIHGTTILGFVSENNNLLLNLTLFDSSNNLVLKIVNNHLYYAISPWDIQFVNRTLTIREKPKNLLIRITFNPPDTIVIEEGRIIYGEMEILIDAEQVLVFGNGYKKLTLKGCTGTVQGNLAIGLLIGALPAEYTNVGGMNCFNLRV
jgi:hypothetical protein